MIGPGSECLSILFSECKFGWVFVTFCDFGDVGGKWISKQTFKMGKTNFGSTEV